MSFNKRATYKLRIFEIVKFFEKIPQNLAYGKFYVPEIAAVDLSKIYFLKNAMKTCKPNNRDLNRD